MVKMSNWLLSTVSTSVFNKSGDYKTSVDVDGISTLHYDQGMSAYAGGIDVWGHKNDDTTELKRNVILC